MFFSDYSYGIIILFRSDGKQFNNKNYDFSAFPIHILNINSLFQYGVLFTSVLICEEYVCFFFDYSYAIIILFRSDGKQFNNKNYDFSGFPKYMHVRKLF